MPIYEFTCSICGKHIEELQSFYKEIPVCCGQEMIRGCGSMSYWIWKGDRNGTTPGIRKYAAELTRQHTRR